jgi:tetraacyldisaccharide 4'-kinase
MDIVVLDALNPFGNGYLLPRGILRERVSSLKRAQMIVLTKTNLPGAQTELIRRRIGQVAPHVLIVESIHKCCGLVDVFSKSAFDHYHLKGVSVVAFCGIADPHSFKHTLNDAGFNLTRIFEFMDHHVYDVQDLTQIRRYALDHDVKVIITTHKDAVKIKDHNRFFEGFHVYYLQVELEMTYGKNVFVERISSFVRH